MVRCIMMLRKSRRNGATDIPGTIAVRKTLSGNRSIGRRNTRRSAVNREENSGRVLIEGWRRCCCAVVRASIHKSIHGQNFERFAKNEESRNLAQREMKATRPESLVTSKMKARQGSLPVRKNAA